MKVNRGEAMINAWQMEWDADNKWRDYYIIQ